MMPMPPTRISAPSTPYPIIVPALTDASVPGAPVVPVGPLGPGAPLEPAGPPVAHVPLKPDASSVQTAATNADKSRSCALAQANNTLKMPPKRAQSPSRATSTSPRRATSPRSRGPSSMALYKMSLQPAPKRAKSPPRPTGSFWADLAAGRSPQQTEFKSPASTDYADAARRGRNAKPAASAAAAARARSKSPARPVSPKRPASPKRLAERLRDLPMLPEAEPLVPPRSKRTGGSLARYRDATREPAADMTRPYADAARGRK